MKILDLKDMVKENPKVLILGDVHAEWLLLNRVIREYQPDVILQTGDFGFWPGHKKLSWKHLFPRNTLIFWCDGNHEDHWALNKMRDVQEVPEPIVVRKNTYYCPRGSAIRLPDGRVVLFMGGADSIDKAHRTLGVDWFQEEIISIADVYKVPDYEKVDIVISHTNPRKFDVVTGTPLAGMSGTPITGKYNDPSCISLDEIYDKFKPKLWFFGHYHMNHSKVYDECKWFTIDCAGNDEWAIDLESV
ncbi:MAG: metallophosphoesterase [Candidatus Peribacteraceae bacterium]|nr:metallophosphoesterase [Candidatus Peribacteraceae bacterium]